MHGLIDNNKVLGCLTDSDLDRPGTWSVGKPGHYYGPSSEEKVAAKLGGNPEDYAGSINWLRWAKSVGWLDARKRLAKMLAVTSDNARLGTRVRPLDRHGREPRPVLADKSTARFDPDDPAAMACLRKEIAELRPTLSDEEHADLLHTARHESGHAVMVLVHGGEVVSITVNSDRSGVCRYRQLNEFCESVVSIAGAVANDEFVNASGCSSDRRTLLDGMRRSMNASRESWRAPVDITDERLLDLAYSEIPHVRETLDRERRFFETLANRLVELRTMSGHAVHKLWDQLGTCRG